MCCGHVSLSPSVEALPARLEYPLCVLVFLGSACWGWRRLSRGSLLGRCFVSTGWGLDLFGWIAGMSAYCWQSWRTAWVVLRRLGGPYLLVLASSRTGLTTL